jgi:N-methylhydantoinase A
MTQEIRIGIDIGGTFTDFVVYEPGSKELFSFKIPSTPNDPALAVEVGLRVITGRLSTGAAGRIIHGSTVATNALLERKGARTAFITTQGFKDILQIGRQNRPALYDFFIDPPPPLVPDELRFEVKERVNAEGKVLSQLEPAQVEHIKKMLASLQVESAAVCLLFSFLHPDHEKIIGEHLRKGGFYTSLSSEILPEYREYERASTTAVNAYVAPILDRYLEKLVLYLRDDQKDGDNGSPRFGLRIMQSNGGQISVEEARRQAVRCILSGPAGGVVGAMRISNLTPAIPILSDSLNQEQELNQNLTRLITFDMGGTSTDVSVIDRTPLVTTESVVGGCPIRIPVLDIHTIGAGGGSIAYVDLGGVLRVGPESAGADPGPASYGNSLLPTVTDANLVLGRLSPDSFLGGKMQLYPERSQRALEELGTLVGISAREAALGVIEIVNAHMERALRLISVERGKDPGRDSKDPFTLLSFGGAGGLHCAELARRLNIPSVVVPALASTLSAFGMLSADIVKDYLQTVMLQVIAPTRQVEAVLDQLVHKGLEEVTAEGALKDTIIVERLLDVRYKGQSYELTIPFSKELSKAFHIAHHQAYGFSRTEALLEIVNVRVRVTGKVSTPILTPEPFSGEDPSPAFIDEGLVTDSSGKTSMVPHYKKALVKPGNRIAGPAIVIGEDTTLWIPSGDRCAADGYGNLHILVEPEPKDK